MSSLNVYEQHVTNARNRFANCSWVTHYVNQPIAPDLLERFLIHFCALGYQMTRPVEGWIRRAGEQCIAVGIHSFGNALVKHAKHESGHEELMRKDAYALVDRRARSGRSRLDAEALLALGPTPGIERYVKLHEDVIASDAPCRQIAIEYEIERLSVEYGAKFVERCVEALGPEVRTCLSFLEDHVTLDVGHTHFNRRQLDRLLDSHPAFLDGLVVAGSAALDAYPMFLDDCARLADAS